MKIQQFLEHHGISTNPFAEEDAQTDPVFKKHCILSTYHPTWDKIYGDPNDPSTSLVFGEKGAGKTAMRLQIVCHLEQFNRSNPEKRVFVIEYDDFNPFLDRFRDRLSVRKQRPDRTLAEWKLWDHMDSILSLAVTGLVDHILEVKQPSGSAIDKISSEQVAQLDRHQSRDLLMLASCYDHSSAETFTGRWNRLRSKLRFRTWKTYWDLMLGYAGTAATIGVTIYNDWQWFKSYWVYFIILLFWLPRFWKFLKRLWIASGIVRHVRVGNREVSPLRKVLMQFAENELSGQPLPNKDRTDDRYELFFKLQGMLKTLGFEGIVVLVDRIDEPHLINGSTEQMKALLWPMLDNKFLKQPGIGLKLLLPIELQQFIDREDREFYQRARLDKQNMIPSLQWTGEALFDVANSRVAACTAEGSNASIRGLFEDSISEERLINSFRPLRVPRHLFKFLYRLFVAHCNAHTEQQPVWEISAEMFESVLAVYSADQDAADRGLKTI